MTTDNADSILIADDNPANLRFLYILLREQGYQVCLTPYSETVLKSARKKLPDLILLDIRMPGTDGYEVCRQLKADMRTRDIPVIFISALDQIPDRVKGFSLGAVDYILKPFVKEELLIRVSGAIERTQKFLDLNRCLKTAQFNYSLLSQKMYGSMKYGMVAESPGMKAVMDMMVRVALSHDTTVLITGESGTGKELVARGIHLLSKRKDAHFHSVNAAAVPVTLFESEFFGHKKGPLPAHPRIRPGGLRLPKTAPCLWMKSASWPRNFRPDCCGFWMNAGSSGSVPMMGFPWMSG